MLAKKSKSSKSKQITVKRQSEFYRQTPTTILKPAPTVHSLLSVLLASSALAARNFLKSTSVPMAQSQNCHQQKCDLGQCVTHGEEGPEGALVVRVVEVVACGPALHAESDIPWRPRQNKAGVAVGCLPEPQSNPVVSMRGGGTRWRGLGLGLGTRCRGCRCACAGAAAPRMWG